MEDSSDTIMIHPTCHEYHGQEPLSINQSLLCHFSAYFGAVLMGDFAESTQETHDIDLRPNDAWIFSRWLSTGRLYDRNYFRFPHKSESIRLYTFADYYDIPALRRAIMLRFASLFSQNNSRTYIFERELGDCLARLPDTSPFYQWLVEHWIHCKDAFLQDDNLNHDIPRGFRHLIADGLAKDPDGRQYRCCSNPCDYHEHESEEEWERSKNLLFRLPNLSNTTNILQSACHCANNMIPKPDPSTYRKPSRAL